MFMSKGTPCLHEGIIGWKEGILGFLPLFKTEFLYIVSFVNSGLPPKISLKKYFVIKKGVHKPLH